MAAIKPSARFVFDRKHLATKSKVKDARKGLVQIEVLYKRKRKFISTGVKVYADQWVDNKELHVVNSAFANEYNKALKDAMAEVLERIDKATENDTFSFDALEESKSGATTVSELSELFISSATLANSTKLTYKSFTNTLSNHFGETRIDAITMRDIEKFDAALQAKGMRNTGRRALLTYLRNLFSFAIRQSFITKNPTEFYKFPKRDTSDRVRLMPNEVEMIANVELPPHLTRWRDLFIFQCYTGIAFADLNSMTRDMIVEEDGKWFINRSRAKTRTRYRVLLLKPALEILRKYDFQLPTGNSHDASFYDLNLRKIEKLCGVNKHLSSHVGRHTFATWALSNGVPIEVVSKMLGHTNIQTTQIYAKILAKDVEAQFLRLDELL